MSDSLLLFDHERQLTSQSTVLKENNCHDTQISARKTPGLLPKTVRFTAKGPAGPLRLFGRPVMTKRPPKPMTPPSNASAPLIVLGYDEQHKPRAAQFSAADAKLVAKAAQLMDLKVYEAATEELAALAKKLPTGRLYANGRRFVPNVRQSLYSELVATWRQNREPRVSKDQQGAAGRDRAAAELGRDRAWSSGDCPREPRLRLVGGDRAAQR